MRRRGPGQYCACSRTGRVRRIDFSAELPARLRILVPKSKYKKVRNIPQKSLVLWRKISDTLGLFQFLDDNGVHLIRIVNCAANCREIPAMTQNGACSDMARAPRCQNPHALRRGCSRAEHRPARADCSGTAVQDILANNLQTSLFWLFGRPDRKKTNYELLPCTQKYQDRRANKRGLITIMT